MIKYRITLSIPDNIPEGTALLFLLAETIKQTTNIVDLAEGKRMSFTEEITNDWNAPGRVTIAKLKP